MENKKLRDLAEVGEFGLIDILTQDFQLKNNNSILGVGDDAAEIRLDDIESLLISTDCLVEGIHFNLMYMPLKFLGYKAVAVNVSDICAMNGRAEQITVSLKSFSY
jgi:thiamine-monophosphate kinase